MRHNPDLIPDGKSVFEHFPELARVTDFRSIDETEWSDAGERFLPDEDDMEKMVRFVIYLCSQESPYYFESDYDARIRICTRSAGIRADSALAGMIIERHWWVRRLIVMYLKTFAKQTFSQWLSMRMLAFNMMEVMMARISPTDKDVKGFVKAQTEASEELSSLMVKISALEQQLFPVPEVGEMVAAQTVFDQINTAESYAADFTIADKFK